MLLYINPLTMNEKDLTAAMINNYVKHRHIQKPEKKKYTRTQVAQLIVITLLKSVFSIQDISRTLQSLHTIYSEQELYNFFIDCMHNTPAENTPDVILSACQTVQRYQNTQQLISTLESGVTHDNLKIE